MTDQEQTISAPNAPEPTSQSVPSSPQRRLGDRRFGATAVLALAALVGLVVWLVVESRKATPKTAANPPVAVNLAGLRKLAAAAGQPIYWAGANKGSKYELTHTAQGFYLRYLPSTAKVGASGSFLTIATFPIKNAYEATKKAGTAPGSKSFAAPGGGIAVFDTKRPTTIYLARPGSNVQVEVYEPSAVLARRLAQSDAVRPVLGSPTATTTTAAAIQGPQAATPAELKSLASKLRHPVYWVGAKAGVTYELTEDAGHSVYVRYLPSGVAVGSKGNYLTVSTYPMKNAFAITSRTSRTPGTLSIKVTGGIGLYSKARPNQLYVAFKGDDVQVGVYDPSPTVPRNLAATGRVVPVG